jgi:hypothetical protein
MLLVIRVVVKHGVSREFHEQAGRFAATDRGKPASASTVAANLFGQESVAKTTRERDFRAPFPGNPSAMSQSGYG